MQVIICNIQLFDLKQVIQIHYEDGSCEIVHAQLPVIQDALVSLCYSKNIKKVHLYGAHGHVNEIANKIKEYEKNIYIKSDIIVEVN